MSLLSGTQLAKSYGAADIFTGVDVAIPHGARIALVGPNGSGKTTLLLLLAGLEAPSQGAVGMARGTRLGYLPQEAARASLAQGSLWEEMLSAFADLRAREVELARLEAAMADPAQFEAVTEKYGPLQRQFELDGGYTYEIRIRQVLDGLGFEPQDFSRPVEILSGGQKTRALLARLLLEGPDLLILDEPTNHLDIQAVEWLETWLGEWPGTALIVSHDRYFLDQTVSTVWEMQFGQLETYRGNYSAYLVQRTERHEQRLAEYEAQQAMIAKEQDFIRRNLAGQNTRQAKGRRRRLERLTREPTGQHPDSNLVERPRESQSMKIQLGANVRSGDRVMEARDLAVGYRDDGKVLFRVPELLLWREECAALVGPNGAGKTTFLKTLLEQVPPLSGTVKLGSNLKVGYFDQAHAGLQAERNVLEEIQSAQAEYMPPGRARDYAARFLFSGDDVFKPVGVLSGGERGRLALAKLALQGANLLLLDEPTNHLDIPAQEVLEAVLADFPGTILLVSHDRYLIEALATQIWVLEDGRLEIFKGNWSEYIAWKQDGRERAAREASPKLKDEKAKPRDPAPANRAQERKRAARVAEVEAHIEALEGRLKEITADLESVGTDVARARALGAEYAEVEAQLGRRLAEWESLSA